MTKPVGNGFKAGDLVVLDRDNDKNLYQIDFYLNIGNGFVMKCGAAISYSLVLRHAKPEEEAAGRRLEACQ